jgi:hypothetical protein
VKFKGASAKGLFHIYMDSEKHGAAVKSTASTSNKVGGRFWVFGKNGLKGRNLHIAPKKMVVQTWRSNLFSRGDPDSILTLMFFTDTNDGAPIDLFHVNVPDNLYDNTKNGWKRMYWSSWREYVKRVTV